MTAGNSSPLNDGASAVVLASADAAEELGAEPLARVVASATHALDPPVMGIAPAFAIPKALERAQVLLRQRSTSGRSTRPTRSVALAILRELPNQLDGFEVPDERLNPNGGAVAIGHPFGSSGTRYVLTLATELRLRGPATASSASASDPARASRSFSRTRRPDSGLMTDRLLRGSGGVRTHEAPKDAQGRSPSSRSRSRSACGGTIALAKSRSHAETKPAPGARTLIRGGRSSSDCEKRSSVGASPPARLR